ncbi:hypothetical protein H8E77_28145 [bacterium]|nr:hypothetical protein [bacterium]
MSVPRILLLAGAPPVYGGGGKIFLHDLCLYYPRESLCCFAVCPNNRDSLPQDLDWLPIAYGSRPREAISYGLRLRELGFQRLVRGIAHPISFLMWQYAKVQIRALIAQAVRFGKQHGVDMVWAVLDSPTLIYMAKRVTSALGAQLVTSVLDPPEYFLSMNSCLDRISRRSLLREFEKVMRASVRCGVISEEMQSEYEKEYGVESVIMRHGIHPNRRKPPAKEPTGEKQFVIGFAGSLYAAREWRALLSALSKLDWRIDGLDITVLVVGNYADFLLQDKAHIKYLGWRSIEETIDLMSEVDVTYLPYWFDESYRMAVRLCFPTKLTTYLASGRPVLFHGPEDSSPASFFRRFPVGLCCHSLEESRIIECLYQFATDKEFYAAATDAGQAALEQELDLRVFLRRFATLIGIDEGELLPI